MSCERGLRRVMGDNSNFESFQCVVLDPDEYSQLEADERKSIALWHVIYFVGVGCVVYKEQVLKNLKIAKKAPRQDDA